MRRHVYFSKSFEKRRRHKPPFSNYSSKGVPCQAFFPSGVKLSPASFSLEGVDVVETEKIPQVLNDKEGKISEKPHYHERFADAFQLSLCEQRAVVMMIAFTALPIQETRAVLFTLCGLDTRKVARMMAVSENAVRVYLCRAKKRIKQIIRSLRNRDTEVD
jgi:DNA-directed RNA polymerase specialized sigma24 family protein